MKKKIIQSVSCVILLSILSGCSLINNAIKFAESINYSDNVNNQSLGDYSQYLNNLKNPDEQSKIKSVQKNKEKAVYKTIDALASLNVTLHSKTGMSISKAYTVLNKKIAEAINAVNHYLIISEKYDCKKEYNEAINALNTLNEAKKQCKENNFSFAASDIKLAILYLVNDKVSLWQFQKDEIHVFPSYLKWGDTSKLGSDDIVQNPDSLVFSGGGAKGTAYVGVLKYLQEQNKLNNVKRYIGTSAGSIMSTVLSISSYYEDHKKTEDQHAWELVSQIMLEAKFLNFIENPLLKKSIKQNNLKPITDNLISTIPDISTDLHNQYALCSGTKIVNFFKEILEKFGIKGDITLKELYELTNKHLILVACSLSYRKAAYFDYQTAPDLQVAHAMRASMAIPFVFRPLKYNNDFFIDGGAVNNYPIDYFDNYGTEDGSTPHTLGFILYAKDKMLRPKWKMIKDPIDYTSSVFSLLMVNTGSALYRKNVSRTVFIDCEKITVLSFNMPNEKKQQLIDNGYNATKKYFEGNQ